MPTHRSCSRLLLLIGLLAACGKEPETDTGARVRDLLVVGAAKAEIEEWGEAREAFSRALELAPEEPAAVFNLALAELRGGDLEAARQVLGRTVVAAPPGLAARWAYLQGKIAYEEGDYAAEAAAYRRAAALDPDNPAYPYALIQVLPRLGEGQQDTGELLERSRALWPANTRLAAEYAQWALAAAEPEIRERGRRLVERLAAESGRPELAALAARGRRELEREQDLESRTARLGASFRRALNLLRPGKRFQTDSARLEAQLALAPVAKPATLEASVLEAASPEVSFEPAALLPTPALAAEERILALEPVTHAIDGPAAEELALLSSRGLYLVAAGEAEFTSLAAFRGGAQLLVGELSGDGWMELVVIGAGGARVLGRGADGAWGQRTMIRAPGDRFAHGLLIDFEHDGDLDLLAVGDEGQPWLVTHRGEAGWGEAAKAPLVVEGPIAALAASDLDGDADQDLVIAYERHLRVVTNQRQGEFTPAERLETTLPASRLLTFDYDLDGAFDLAALVDGGLVLWRNTGVGGLERDSRALAGLPEDVGAIAAADVDLDGDLDLAVAGAAGTLLLTNDGGGGFGPASPLVAEPASGLALVDLDGDRDSDLAFWRAATLGSYRAAGAEDQGWLELRLRGLAGKVPLDGRGARVMVAAGGRRQWLEPGRPAVVAGVGARQPALVQVTWPNGISEYLFEPALGREHTIEQVLRIEGSCPFLYASSGEGMRFVTDILGLSPLGMLASAGRYVPADPEEYLRLPEWVTEQDGGVELRITEELREVAYIDQTELVVVDSPPGVVAYNGERWVVPPVAGLDLRLLGPLVAPAAVLDGRGRPALDEIMAKDHRYLTPGPPRGRLYQGAAKPHHLTVELPPAVARAPRPVLVLEGWLHWGNTSTNVARSQDPRGAPVFPYLEVPDAGGWRRTPVQVGLPAGKSKPVVVDLTGVLDTADPRLRITTDFEVYWDRIAVGNAVVAAETPHRIHRLLPGSARLAWGGFSRWYRPSPDGPYLFDYDDRRSYPWRVGDNGAERRLSWQEHEGHYTRFGDVSDLVTGIDDRLVVFGSGEALSLRFETGELPPLPSGWSRTYFLHSEGWEKDGDPNVACSQTVEPLPSRDAPGYPCAEALVETMDEAADRRDRWVERDRLERRVASRTSR